MIYKEAQKFLIGDRLKIVKTQPNSTQLKTTLKQLALELDTVVTCSEKKCVISLLTY